MKRFKTFFQIGYFTLVIFPFLYLLILSLSSNWSFPNVWPEYFGAKNWQLVLSGASGLMQSFILSMAISLSVALSSTLGGFFISRIISYHRQRKVLTLVTYFPYIMAPVVFAACLSYYFLKIGWYGSVFGVMVAQFFIAFPYAVIFFLSFWNRQMYEYQNLVSTLGGSSRVLFTKVLFPLGKEMLLICFFQTFLISWFEYGLSSLIGVGKVETLTIKVFLFIKESNFYFGAMSCCLLVLPPMILIYLNKKYVFKPLL